MTRLRFRELFTKRLNTSVFLPDPTRDIHTFHILALFIRDLANAKYFGSTGMIVVN